MGYCALHHRHTFDHDVDGVVHRAQPVPGGAAVISCVWFGHVHNAKGPLVVQEGGALGWEIAAHFGPGDFGGGPGFKERARKREETKSDDDTRAGGHLRLSGSNGGFFHLQSFGNALHLQHLSSQHYLGAGGARWDEEGWLPLIRWVFYSYTHTQIHRENYYPLFCVSPCQSGDQGLNQALHIHNPFFSVV